jgi:hypothetical protein
MKENHTFLTKEEYNEKKDNLINLIIKNDVNPKMSTAMIDIFNQTTHKKGLLNRIRTYSEEIYGVFLIGYVLYIIIILILYIIDNIIYH